MLSWMILTERAFISLPVSLNSFCKELQKKKRSLKYGMCSYDPTKVAAVMLKVFTRDAGPSGRVV